MEVTIDMKGVLKFFPINVRRGSNFFMAGQHNSLFVLSKWTKSYLPSLPSPSKDNSAQSEEGNSPWSEHHSHPSCHENRPRKRPSASAGHQQLGRRPQLLPLALASAGCCLTKLVLASTPTRGRRRGRPKAGDTATSGTRLTHSL